MAIVDEHKTAQYGEGRAEAASQRVNFSEAQQARVQELIDETYRKAYAKASREMVSKTELDRLSGEIGALKEERKTAAVLRSLSRHNVVDASEVAEILRQHVGEDSGGGFVSSGPLRDSRSPAALPLDEYVDAWLAERPHHLRLGGFTGSGSRASMFGHGRRSHNLSDPGSWRTMAREDLDRLLQDGVTVRGMSGQVFKFKDVKNPFVEARKRRGKTGG